jgi:hydroxymethylpyrimidine/phosphomethylpyrimidine kinase
LAQGETLVNAAQHAKDYIHQAILHADELSIGEGSGPVNHFYQNK